ncbi:hypothetical protein [Halopseudomonas salegens]|uniref:Glucose-inhibited division protein B n=1 Tax=Halopseudomonas salegens TaxID=1434072 RepID=A0A1H2FC41_9GAMM|nr:hypothetical protein [Halopseudomonas salegens]SDU04914.1 hypothetical protein SAMN05216210_1446 [Halopseudomonas salegens]
MLVHRIIAACFALGMLVACTETANNEPITVDLPHLVAEHQAYDGRLVTVSGRVAGFDDPEHYWLEDDEYNRVGLLPDDLISDRVGQRVQVTGRFSTSRDQGRRIQLSAVQALNAAD